ncbi:hypothetical protein ElyMa_002666300 [Elysia marginata]|uniref:Uncharacterized protein n=1 Tax=Elysia marginata TaxID=1093978 RepID=A0AAV4HA96_9GAST|nr:hypothetical protein ElyMa_002666300 [Elysia marginata]
MLQSDTIVALLVPQNVPLATMEKDVKKLAVNIVLVTETPVIISLVVVIKDVIPDIEALTVFRNVQLEGMDLSVWINVVHIALGRTMLATMLMGRVTSVMQVT